MLPSCLKMMLMMICLTYTYVKTFLEFWKKLQKRFSKRNTNPPHVNGNTDEHAIAECFNEYF